MVEKQITLHSKALADAVNFVSLYKWNAFMNLKTVINQKNLRGLCVQNIQ